MLWNEAEDGLSEDFDKVTSALDDVIDMGRNVTCEQ
jgi:hypothetical protein